ncbi:MAG TPA: hypothetical protein VH253_17010 [Phycisphaerae bacterium]|nr:hypothetical protein [Phycisphaerae bacterium]
MPRQVTANDEEPTMRLLAAWTGALPWPVTAAHLAIVIATSRPDPLVAAMRSLLEVLCRTAPGRPRTARHIGCFLRHLRRRRFGEMHIDRLTRSGAGRLWAVMPIPAAPLADPRTPGPDKTSALPHLRRRDFGITHPNPVNVGHGAVNVSTASPPAAFQARG